MESICSESKRFDSVCTTMLYSKRQMRFLRKGWIKIKHTHQNGYFAYLSDDYHGGHNDDFAGIKKNSLRADGKQYENLKHFI